MNLMKVLLTLASCSQIAVLFSPATPFSSKDLLDLVPDHPQVTVIWAANEEDGLSKLSGEERLLDYSYMPGLGVKMKILRLEEIVGMYEGCIEQETQGKLTAQETTSAIAAYLQAMNFTQLFLAVSATPFYLQLAQSLHSQPFLIFTHVTYLRPKLSREEVRQFVGRVLKPAGSTVTALLVDEETGVWLYDALEDFHIYRQGYAYIFSDEAVWTTRPDGALYVTDSAAIAANSRLHYEALILSEQLRNLTQHRRPMSLSLINIHEGRLLPVAPHSTMYFPGNTTVKPELRKPHIRVSADLSALNFDGSTILDAVLIRVATQGTVVGYTEANRRIDIMTNLQFNLTEVNLGGILFNKTWATAQLVKYENRIGVAFNGLAFGGTAIALNKLFAELGKYIPNTSFATSSALSDSTVFPMFLRTSSSNASYVIVMLRFFSLFGWKRVAFICADASGDIDIYQLFLNYSSQYGIEIVNEEKKRMLPLGLEVAQQQLNETVQEILKSTVRVLVVSHAQAELIAERLYDFGARVGDYIICTTYGLSYTYFQTNPESAHKRKAIFKGALMFYDRYFSGAEGQRTIQLLKASVGENYHPMSCVYYDSAMLVAHAVSYMLARGLNYEDGRELIAEMRKTRFSGCIGTIQFESGSNNRRSGDYSVANLHVTGDNETVEIVDAALYSPSKIQLFTIFPSFQFPDGSTTFPDSWEEDEVCPYLAKDIRDFAMGRYIGLVSSTAVTGLTVCVAVFTWVKQKGQAIPLFQEKAYISIQDVLVLCMLPIEFIQLCALGPSLKLHYSISRIGALSLFSLEELVRSHEGVFWKEVSIALSLVALLFMILAVRLLRVGFKTAICGWCEFWWQFMLPCLYSFLFIPICFTLLSVFQCDKSTGESLTDSFLNRDCHQTCWSGAHLSLAVLSAVSLCGYIVLSIPAQMLWQQDQTDLHVRIRPSYISIKSSLLVAVVAACASCKAANSFVYAILYIALTGLHAIVLCLMKPCNYERMNLWVRLFALAVCMYGVLSFATQLSETFSVESAGICLAVSYGVLAVIGLAVQFLLPKYRSFLVREKEDRYDIIRFAFTYGGLAQMHLQNFRAKRAQHLYMQGLGHRSTVEDFSPPHNPFPLE